MIKYKPADAGPPIKLPSLCTWRPWPIRTPFIAAFSVLCIFFCIAIELILRGCAETGCHVFGEMSTTHVSQKSNFIYNILPTLLLVCFGLLWTVVHHDILRLEPYFQMSKLNGALAADSLLLQYPYVFPLYIPYLAWRRKHYVVFLSSCILLLTNFLVTPLISGLFDDTELMKSITTTADLGSIRNEERPEGRFSTGFSFAAYEYQWLGGTLPSFTTPMYALLPIRSTDMMVENETWTAETTLFEAELVCESALITLATNPDTQQFGLNITSPLKGRHSCLLLNLESAVLVGCPPTANRSAMFDSNYYYDGNLDYYDLMRFVTPWAGIAVPVGGNKSETTLFAWASPEASSSFKEPNFLPRNLTAIFCTPSYYSQTVTAIFAMPSGKITNVTRTGSRIPFLGAIGFARVFRGKFRDEPETRPIPQAPAKYWDSASYPSGIGYRPGLMPNIDTNLRMKFGARGADQEKVFRNFEDHGFSTSNVYLPDIYTLPAFAMYRQTNKTLGQLFDPLILAETLQREFQTLFALAVTLELVDDGAATAVTVTRDVVTRGFRVASVWARSAQSGLILLAILVAVLAGLVSRRRCELDGEPNCLAAALQILAVSPDFCAQMINTEFSSDKDLHCRLISGGKRYKLVRVQERGPMIHVDLSDEQKKFQAMGNHFMEGPVSDEQQPLCPDTRNPWIEATLWMLNTVTGLGLLAFFGVVTALLIVVYWYASRNNGLPTLGGSSSFAYKLVFSYLPFVVGISVEPVLVSIGSCYFMLGPYETLRHQHARSDRSIAVDYDKSPPHFQLLYSLQMGNLGLATLTLAILLANMLAVALAGLFSPFSADFNIHSQVETFGPPMIKGGIEHPDRDMFYMLDAYISGRNNLPTWTTSNLYLVPFYPLNSGIAKNYQGLTVGIGANISCDMHERWNTPISCVFREDAVCLPISLDFRTNESCFDSNILLYSPSMDDLRESDCIGGFFAVWAEIPGDPHPNDTSTLYKQHADSVFLTCTATEILYELTATVSGGHQVLSTTNIRQIDREDITEVNTTARNSFLHLLSGFLISLNPGSFTEFVGESRLPWLNFFMASFNPSIVQRDLPNVTHIPNTTHLVSAFEDVLKRLFAIHLRLNADKILSVGNSFTTDGTAIVQKERVGVNGLMFFLSIGILLYMILVVAELYWWQRPHIFGHIPTSLAGMYTLLYASNGKEYCGSGCTPKERARSQEGRYSYGLFKAKDGIKHFGVYREEDEPAELEMADKNNEA